MSSYLINPVATKKYEADGQWSGPQGLVLVDIKRSNNIRDIRDTLISLTYVLSEQHASATALCVVSQSKLSHSRLLNEIEQFRVVIHKELADRIHLATLDDDGCLTGSPYDHDPDFLQWLKQLVEAEVKAVSVGRSNQQSVYSMLAQLWLRGEGPQSFKALQHLCKASYPTVALAVKALGEQGFIEQISDRSVQLRYLTPQAWREVAKGHGVNRKKLRFMDPTGQTRSPEAMASRLFKLQQQGLTKNIAVGGVVGAKHYFPDLDITASPRLDLSVYGDNTEFVRKLDAALELTDDPKAHAVVVIHRTPGITHFIDSDNNGNWAPEMDCIADLFELGLERETMDMVTALSKKRTLPKGVLQP